MKLRIRRYRLLIAAVVLTLLAFVLYPYSKSQKHEDPDYFETVALVNQLKQLDAHWELGVLKSRIGTSSNYDQLADYQVELTQRLDELGAAAKIHNQFGEAAALEKSHMALSLAIGQKASLIEEFKSKNAVLRNSLVFLPTAADDVGRAVAGAGESGQTASIRSVDGVNRILLSTMLYSQSPSDDRRLEIQSQLKALSGAHHLAASLAAQSLGIFRTHALTVLREQQGVNELVGRIAAVPTAAAIANIYIELAREQHRDAANEEKFHTFLAFFSLALVALLLFAAFRLASGHALNKRINKELQSANAHLEQRVQERTHELEQAQGKLLTTARQAGMAEIATNVLHNVGNILNSVNVSADLVCSMLRTSKAQRLARAVGLMNDHADDLGHFLTLDDKGKLLPGYLTKVTQALMLEQEGMVQELGHLTRSIDHIRDVVATQQSYAGNSNVVIPLQICDLAEDALRINGSALSRHQVTVVKQFAPVPVAPLDRARVLQILVNLISNAKSAMDNVVDDSHQMTVSIDVVGDSDRQRLRVRVTDEGEGIHPENLTRIFSHGFTTRKDGHGFGLHSCALAAQQMGGALSASSDGAGRGATFTLELPLHKVQVAV